MSLLKTVDLIQSKHSQGSYVKGKWVEGTTEQINFKGTWQPSSGKVMELLPEGKRNRETYICYAPIELSFTSSDPELGVTGDEIVWEGKSFEVCTASKWNNGLIPHWELICVKNKEGEN